MKLRKKMIRAYEEKKHPRGDAISPRGYLVCVWAT